MKTLDLFFFLTSFTVTVGCAMLFSWLRHRDWKLGVGLVAILLIIPANAIVASKLDPTRSAWGILRFLVTVRDTSSVLALVMGFGAGLAWMVHFTVPRLQPIRWYGWESLLLTASVGIVVAGGQAYLWKDVLGVTRHPIQVHSEQFTIDKIADFNDDPMRLAISENDEVFICYDYFKKHGALGGTILRLQQESPTSPFELRTIVESPFLARCYGMAIRNGSIFVSRSGFFPEIQNGMVHYASTGAITQLQDLNGDGYYEYAHDIVTDLPGVRAPDTMQQNNGIAFAPDGSLYITNASAADRTLEDHPWGGAILRVPPNGGEPEVFARGFRNPWTITVGPDGCLFATDNDVDQNPGDEINHVVQGGHYGHPYVIPEERDVEAVGFREPMVVGERETVFLGMTYATAPQLPEAYRNCLYVTDFRRNRIMKIRLKREGDTYTVSDMSVFASVPTPVDIVSSSKGEFFVISRRAHQLYRIRPLAEASQKP